jgi:hypothetical protein
MPGTTMLQMEERNRRAAVRHIVTAFRKMRAVNHVRDHAVTVLRPMYRADNISFLWLGFL